MARLPIVGGDRGNWGSILNDFLSQSLNANGSLKPDLYSLNSLSDVDISNPVDSQIISYSVLSSTWKNIELLDGNTPFTNVELAPIDALLIGDAYTFGPLPGYTYTTATDSNDNGYAPTITATENGALVADGYTAKVGDRIAFWDNATEDYGAPAGVYTVTATGDSSSPFVLTIAPDGLPLRNWVANLVNSDLFGPGLTVRFFCNLNGYGQGTNSDWLITLTRGGFSAGSSSAIGSNAFAEGDFTLAENFADHSEGIVTTASGGASHAEGANTQALNYASHAEGIYTVASDEYAHAEGNSTTASGTSSHAEGQNTTASQSTDHAEGYGTTASGGASHAEGVNANAYAPGQHAHSSGNIADAGPTANWSQYTRCTACCKTTTDSPTLLSVEDVNGNTSTATIRFPNWNITAVVNIRVVAVELPLSSGVSSAWQLSGVISGDGSSSYRWVGGAPPTFNLLAQDSSASAWELILAIGDDNKSIVINAVGASSTEIDWHATIELDEVS